MKNHLHFMPPAISHTTIDISFNAYCLREDGKLHLNLSLQYHDRDKVVFSIVTTIVEKQSTVFCGNKFQLDMKLPVLFQSCKERELTIISKGKFINDCVIALSHNLCLNIPCKNIAGQVKELAAWAWTHITLSHHWCRATIIPPSLPLPPTPWKIVINHKTQTSA